MAEMTAESVEKPEDGAADISAEAAPEFHQDMGPDEGEGAQVHQEGLEREERYEERRLSRLSAMSGEHLSLQDGHLDDVPESWHGERRTIDYKSLLCQCGKSREGVTLWIYCSNDWTFSQSPVPLKGQ